MDYILRLNKRFSRVLYCAARPLVDYNYDSCYTTPDLNKPTPTHETRLPIELYRNIIEHSYNDCSTLLALTLTCHYLKDEAERVLYFSIDSNSRVRFPTLLLQHILSFPNLARHVRHLSVPELARKLGLGKTMPFRSLVTQVLPTLVNLKSLSLCCWDSETASTLLDCTFQLRSLNIISWSSALESDIVTFLTKQSELEELEFLATGTLEVSPTALPKLKRLSATACTLETLLNGRSVENVVWVSYHGSEKEVDVPVLASSLENIKTLKLGSQSTPLGTFAKHLVQLEHLELQVPSDEDLLCVPELPALKTLVLSGTIDALHEDKLIESLFHSKTLERVDVEQEWLGERYSRRWRNGHGSVPVPTDVC